MVAVGENDCHGVADRAENILILCLQTKIRDIKVLSTVTSVSSVPCSCHHGGGFRRSSALRLKLPVGQARQGPLGSNPGQPGRLSYIPRLEPAPWQRRDSAWGKGSDLVRRQNTKTIVSGLCQKWLSDVDKIKTLAMVLTCPFSIPEIAAQFFPECHKMTHVFQYETDKPDKELLSVQPIWKVRT